MGKTVSLPGPGVALSADQDIGLFLGSDPAKLRYLEVAPIHLGQETGAASPGTVGVGLIDTGVNPDHPQLAGKIAEMVSFTDAPPEDRFGHGTGVAIVLAAYASIRVVSANVMDMDFGLRVDPVISAIDWLVREQKVFTINISLGFPPETDGASDICRKISDLRAEGYDFIISAAAGNSGPDQAMLPAACEEGVIAVASPEATSGKGDVIAPLPKIMNREAYLRNSVQAPINNRDYEAAYPILEELAKLAPQDGQVHYAFAVAAFSIGQTPNARDAAQTTVELVPDLADARWLLALAEANLSRSTEAKAALEKLLGIAPEFPNAAALLELLRSEPMDLPGALRVFFSSVSEE